MRFGKLNLATTSLAWDLQLIANSISRLDKMLFLIGNVKSKDSILFRFFVNFRFGFFASESSKKKNDKQDTNRKILWDVFGFCCIELSHSISPRFISLWATKKNKTLQIVIDLLCSNLHELSWKKITLRLNRDEIN